MSPPRPSRGPVLGPVTGRPAPAGPCYVRGIRIAKGGNARELRTSKVNSSDVEPCETPTALLLAWGRGEADAFNRLVPLVHAELRRLAVRYMSRERPGHTLQATA